MEKQKLQRLESLDVLRGFDLFCLVGLEVIIHRMQAPISQSWYNNFMWNFSHIEWAGFSPWDLVMPLFLFMSGVSIPFALSRYRSDPNKLPIYRRIIKRFLLLWIFGMMCQGNLLALDPDHIYFYSNTLQSIAVGYLVSSILFLHTKVKSQIVIAAGLVIGYWAIMQFATAGNYGGGNYTQEANMAEWIDRVALGRFRDHAEVLNGEVIFSDRYRYTWILSSLNFIVTVMTGLFAGHILRNKEMDAKKKWLLLLGIGIAMVAAGWLWHFQMPVIKKIWTSSMVLVSSGYCFLLMAISYYWIDYKGHKKHLTWLKVYGMNSITAYMLAMCVNFSCIGQSLLSGLEQYIGNWYPVLIATINAAIIYLILWTMYKKNIFLKV